MRISKQMASFGRRYRKLGDRDWMVRFRPTPATRRKSPGLPQELAARLIRYQRPGFRPSYLLTSLGNSRRFPPDELIDLYHRRWQMETFYREWKHTLDIQNLRSHTPLGILKEVHAHLLLSNLVRWIMTEACETTSYKPVELSFLTSLSHIKNTLWFMLYLPTREIVAGYEQLLNLIRSATIRQRPGRSYPRRRDGRVKNMGYGKYRLPARLKNKP